MLKRLTHTGSTLRARSVADKAAIARAVEEHVLPLIAAGKVKPVIDSTFPLREAAAAHARMEASTHIGKIVLTVCRLMMRFRCLARRSMRRRIRGPRGARGRAGREIDVKLTSVVPLAEWASRPAKLVGGSTGVELGGRRLHFVRACVTAMLALLAVGMLGLSPARAVEAVNVRIDAPAIDLTDAVERHRTDADRSWSRPRPAPTASSAAWTCARARATPTGRYSRSPIPATSRSSG